MNAATRYITVGVQNVINEGLAATSVNVRGTLNVNREKRKFIGSFAAYGYLKDPADHHRLSSSFSSIPRRFSLRESFEIGTYSLKRYLINPGTFQWAS